MKPWRTLPFLLFSITTADRSWNGPAHLDAVNFCHIARRAFFNEEDEEAQAAWLEEAWQFFEISKTIRDVFNPTEKNRSARALLRYAQSCAKDRYAQSGVWPLFSSRLERLVVGQERGAIADQDHPGEISHAQFLGRAEQKDRIVDPSLRKLFLAVHIIRSYYHVDGRSPPHPSGTTGTVRGRDSPGGTRFSLLANVCPDVLQKAWALAFDSLRYFGDFGNIRVMEKLGKQGSIFSTCLDL